MRQRITFIHEPQDAIDPQTLQFSKGGKLGPSLTLKGLKAAREDRITLGYDEVPQKLRKVLGRTSEVHIKHVGPGSSKTLAPFDARVGNGVHVSFRGLEDDNGSELSQWLVEEFNMKTWDACGDMNSYSFASKPAVIEPSSQVEGRLTAYYITQSELPPNENLGGPRNSNSRWGNLLGEASTLTRGWSEERLTDMNEATSIDIDIDASLGAQRFLTITAYWAPREWESTTIEGLVPTTGSMSRIEVGVMSNEPPERPEEVKLAGYLMVLGEDTKPKPTMFSFPSKHHSHEAVYGASWIEPTGLHPNLGLKIDNSIPPKDGEECKLYAHLTLPRTIFADRYQFTDSLFLASKNLSELTWTSSSVDLEAPEYAAAAQVSTLLLELQPPSPANSSWTAEIPLHTRYQKPSESGYREAHIPTPMLFWGCEADDMGGRNPFERQGMVIEKLLPAKNVFYHLSLAEGADGYQTVSVPVLSTQYEGYIEGGTATVILLGFGWVMWKALQVLMRVGYGSAKVKIEAKKE